MSHAEFKASSEKLEVTALVKKHQQAVATSFIGHC